MIEDIVLHVDGKPYEVRVADDDLLLDVLREQVGVTCVREGCGVGACGACTALVSGRSVSTCLARAIRYDGAEIATASGLPGDDDVVEAFVASNAMQCGYCTPGFVMMAHELLRENPQPTSEDVAAHLEGNLCRCGAYEEISKAVLLAAERRALYA